MDGDGVQVPVVLGCGQGRDCGVVTRMRGGGEGDEVNRRRRRGTVGNGEGGRAGGRRGTGPMSE